MSEDVREFGTPGKGLRDTLTEIEEAVKARADRPKKVEAGAWTMNVLRKLGEQMRDEQAANSIFGGFHPPEAEAMAPLVGWVPVWVDKNLPHGVIRVYWIEDNEDRA